MIGAPTMDIYTAGPDGSDGLDLTGTGDVFHAGQFGPPVWSPDSAHILYVSSATGSAQDQDLEIIDRSGHVQTNLTMSSSVAEHSPRWAEDGQSIIFVREGAGTIDLYRMDRDGTNQRPIGLLMSGDRAYDVSPGETKVAWTSPRAGSTDIYVANADGTNTTSLTGGSGNEGNPRWRPCSE